MDLVVITMNLSLDIDKARGGGNMQLSSLLSKTFHNPPNSNQNAMNSFRHINTGSLDFGTPERTKDLGLKAGAKYQTLMSSISPRHHHASGKNVDLYLPHLKPKGVDLK